MPKPVDDMVDKMLSDKSFYPKKSKEDRESTAWAIALKYNKRKKKSYWIIDGKLIKTALDVKIYQARLADELGNFKKADSIDNLIRLAYNEYDEDDDDDWHAQSGEYWVDEYGNAHYADSDVGYIGHDDLAEQEILTRLGYDTEEINVDNPYQEIEVLNKFTAEDILENNLHRAHMQDYRTHLAEQNQEHYLPNYLRYIRKRKSPKENPEKHNLETESLIKGLVDARTFARKNFGWIRVVKRGNVVDLELEKLTPAVLKNIKSSLGEIAGYDENLNRLRFNIEVYSPRQVALNNVSLEDIENGNVLSQHMQELREQLPPQVADEYYKKYFGTVGHPYYRGRVGD